MSVYLLVQPQTWKDSPKGSSNSRYSLSNILFFSPFEGNFCNSFFFREEDLEKGRKTPSCYRNPAQTAMSRACCPRANSYRSTTGADSASELRRPPASAASPREAHFGGFQSLGCRPSCLLVEVSGRTDLAENQARPVPSNAYRYVALRSQTGSNNEVEIKGHLSDKTLPGVELVFCARM